MVRLIGAPTGVGTGTPGCEYAPGVIEQSLPDFDFTMLKHEDSARSEADCTKNFHDVLAWAALITKEFDKAFAEGHTPGLIGGDHSLAIGSINSVSKFTNKNFHVLWFDAHADVNSPRTSPTGNMHGMPVHYLMKMGCMRPDQITYFGLRSVDPGEVQFIDEHNIKFFTTHQCKENFKELIAEAVKDIPADTHIHVSFDIDFFSPDVAPGVGTPEIDGPSDTTLTWLDAIPRVNSFDVVELNPERDVNDVTTELTIEVVKKLSRDHDVSYVRGVQTARVVRKRTNRKKSKLTGNAE